MTRALQVLNLLGVLVLAGICVVQWQRDRRVHMDLGRVERDRIALEETTAEQEKAIAGLSADLGYFKDQFTQARTELDETRASLEAAEAETARLEVERDQLTESLAAWKAAVSERDERLHEAVERIRSLNERVETTAFKFNELASNYNAVVSALNEARVSE